MTRAGLRYTGLQWPVVSVGNLAAGGLGKTPVVDWLVKHFTGQGKRVAVVSRGYAGNFSGEVGVVSAEKGLRMDPVVAGDEPVLLARRNPGVPVLIARKRVAAIREIERNFTVDLVLLDDAFQHRSVGRTVDLVLLDAARPLGNGWPLPAGNLREFPAAINRADLALLTRVHGPTGQIPGIRTYRSSHVPAGEVVALDGTSVAVDAFSGRKLLAFAGIADPDGFFSAVEDLGLDVAEKIPLADHVSYSSDILQKIADAAKRVDALITTEKDAVKLRADMFELPCYQVPLTIEIEDADAFSRHLDTLLWS